MIEYVCGFLVSADDNLVALLRKARPDRQRGRMNGVGGKIEPGETPAQAMAREFQQEAGVTVHPEEWTLCVVHRGPGHCVYFFRARRSEAVPLRVDGDEPCGWVGVHQLHLWPVIPNLHWLVPICLDDDLRFPIEVYDHSDPQTNGATVRTLQAEAA